jgi:HSP20 family molecular chaperone IbpA
MLPALFGWGTAPPAQNIKVEVRFGAEEFVVRAELPGMDPEHDMEVTVSDDLLTIRAERTEDKNEARHSEFRYGTLRRSLRLPADVKPEEITASYDAGILTVTVPLQHHHKHSARAIAVKSGKGRANAKQ